MSVPGFHRASLGIVLTLAVASALSVLSCGDEDTKFAVKYAPGFTKDGNAISVFGVFKNGRLSPDAWDEIGPRFSRVLHSKDTCDVAVSNGLRATTPNTFNMLDDVARSGGITDELLDKLAPSATGDSILVITIAGRTPRSRDGGAGPALDVSENVPVGTTTTTQGRMGGRRGGGQQQQRQPHPQSNPNVFEISASLFSIRSHQSVALVGMTYSGTNEEEAYTKFLEKFAASFPGATCRGWDLSVHLDEDAIRKLVE